MKPAFLLAFVVLLLIARKGLADDVHAWRTWLELRASAGQPAKSGLPSERELGALRSNQAWLARWTQPPSLAWNDVATELVVKYQQTPLRATRTFAYVHTV